MRRILGSALASLVLGSLAFSVQAETGMDKQQISKYFGVISCVDRTFFDGGYDVGDPDRESLMSEVLARYGLPKYDEELFQKEDEIKKDNDSYLEAYMACGDDDWVIEVAEQRGITPEE